MKVLQLNLNSLILWKSFLLFPAWLSAQDQNYYLSATGNDSNDGLSVTTAWRSLAKINETDFKPGDSIFLEGGAVFKGAIRLTSDDNGLPGQAVVFSSYGKGKAVIDAGDGDGLLAINTSYLKLSSLRFEGSGTGQNTGFGIHFFAYDSTAFPSHIELENCDAKGFTRAGITFGAPDNPSWKGYDQVRIVHCNASENGGAGISSYGSHRGFQHRNFYLGYCKAFRNRGILTQTDSHSGNGIVMGMVDGLLIEFCEAFENGADNRCTAGGPVGIWVWMCKNAVIQHCVSHDNYAGLTKDGGGFDIDGGASNCILQYNYSYNNEGAGYLLAEYGALFPFTNNTVRFNISINDGRKNGYGGITIWGAAADYRVANTWIYNNTIFVDDKEVVNSKPAAVTVLGPHFRNVVVANNILATNGDVYMISADSAVGEQALQFLHNNYYSYTGQYPFQWGKRTTGSLPAWLTLNPAQEQWEGHPLFLNLNPLLAEQKKLTSPAAGRPGDYFRYKGLRLLPSSPLRKAIFNLPEYFAIPANTTDYGNRDLPANGWVGPGACTQ